MEFLHSITENSMTLDRASDHIQQLTNKLDNFLFRQCLPLSTHLQTIS